MSREDVKAMLTVDGRCRVTLDGPPQVEPDAGHRDGHDVKMPLVTRLDGVD